MGKGKKGKKGKKGAEVEEEEDIPDPVYEIAPVLDLDGGDATHNNVGEEGDIHDLLNVDVLTPLEDHEVLPIAQHRVVPDQLYADKSKDKAKKSKKGKSTDSKKKHKGGDNDSSPKKEKSHKSKRKSSNKDDQEKQTTLLAVASEYAKEAKESDTVVNDWLSPAAAVTPTEGTINVDDSNRSPEPQAPKISTPI